MATADRRKPEFVAGDVLVFRGSLMVVKEYDPDGFWEDSDETYSGFVIARLDEFSCHDVEVGLPLCRVTSHLDWTHAPTGTFPPIEDTTYVITDIPLYLWAGADLELVGKLSPEIMAKAADKRLSLLLEEGVTDSLTEEDYLCRQVIKSAALDSQLQSWAQRAGATTP